VHLRNTGQFIDEDAPDDIVDALRSWRGESGSGEAPGPQA